ncbi:MAG TPA: sigma 54-interacting transcriptional regulator, partial [Candidatus Acidoferrum sp.]|nr:sigma 54-interacting transcriptional regulator [Candidatus Acidoferrum sp.]
SRFWANVILAAIRGEDGKLLGFSKVTRDLTERKRFEQELENERDRLRLLLELTNQVVSSLDLRSVFRAVSTSLRRFAQADAAMLLLPDPERNRLRLFALEFPESRGFLREDLHIPVEGSSLGQVFRTGEPRVIEGPDLPPDASEILRAAAEEGVRSSCALPLINRERVIGVLALSRKAAVPFLGGEVDFLLQGAAQVAIAVENALDYHQVIRASERLAEERLYLQDEIRTECNFEEMVAESFALKEVLKQVEHVAPTDSTVLILGETGSGKERVARAIHDCSARRDRSFIKMNCAAIPLGLLESELFGHEKGAFTGAIARKVGRFELAHQGTLFLDEVGDIPLELQPKLLRVLQDQEFERLGSTRTQRVDVRLVAATNRDLAQMIADRQFRDDLYYRLNVFPIRVPPLRERREDIPCLVRHFVSLYARRMNKRIDSISPGDMEAFAQYPWPGNVRELQNFVERAVILSSGRVLHLPLNDLPQTVERPPAPDTTMRRVEREHILRALQATNWVVGGPKGAAAYLGLKRTTLLARMERLGILRRSR